MALLLHISLVEKVVLMECLGVDHGRLYVCVEVAIGDLRLLHPRLLGLRFPSPPDPACPDSPLY